MLTRIWSKRDLSWSCWGHTPKGTENVSPGCDACVDVYRALFKVARFIVPENKDLPTRYEIEPFEPALLLDHPQEPS